MTPRVIVKEGAFLVEQNRSFWSRIGTLFFYFFVEESVGFRCLSAGQFLANVFSFGSPVIDCCCVWGRDISPALGITFCLALLALIHPVLAPGTRPTWWEPSTCSAWPRGSAPVSSSPAPVKSMATPSSTPRLRPIGATSIPSVFPLSACL